MFETPAYWVERARDGVESDGSYCLGDSLIEEVVACVLGGYGVTYELNVAAFTAVRDAGLLDPEAATDLTDLVAALSQPLGLPSGRAARYRFPNQKAKRIASALPRLWQETPPSEPLAAREWLLTFEGIGPKTSSWVVRNRWPRADVAIIDIHVWRAAVSCGVFDTGWTPARDYWQMEAVFLEWAKHGGVSAASLDVTIWAERSGQARRSTGSST
ncbi:hypothetical protein [Plantibacter flavus]|uniref:8-oxoguanine DNA glycosylase n=1 Tax=Plantibacter flavus TaxID=150123 RepID=UPI003D161F52